jgi:hypothetical protein
MVHIGIIYCFTYAHIGIGKGHIPGKCKIIAGYTVISKAITRDIGCAIVNLGIGCETR